MLFVPGVGTGLRSSPTASCRACISIRTTALQRTGCWDISPLPDLSQICTSLCIVVHAHALLLCSHWCVYMCVLWCVHTVATNARMQISDLKASRVSVCGLSVSLSHVHSCVSGCLVLAGVSFAWMCLGLPVMCLLQESGPCDSACRPGVSRQMLIRVGWVRWMCGTQHCLCSFTCVHWVCG